MRVVIAWLAMLNFSFQIITNLYHNNAHYIMPQWAQRSSGIKEFMTWQSKEHKLIMTI